MAKGRSITILAGLAGSGKSTFAARLAQVEYLVLSSDAIRTSLCGGMYPCGTDRAALGRELGRDGRTQYELVNDLVWPIMEFAFGKLLSTDCDIVIDATNLTKQARSRWIDLARGYKTGRARIGICWFDTDFDNAQRWHQRGYSYADWQDICAYQKSNVELPLSSEADLVLRISDSGTGEIAFSALTAGRKAVG
jgi:predicted kinase